MKRRFCFRNIPERSLEPPEDGRQVYADCVVCNESIKEYDDCYEFDNLGCICMTCATGALRIEVTL